MASLALVQQLLVQCQNLLMQRASISPVLDMHMNTLLNDTLEGGRIPICLSCIHCLSMNECNMHVFELYCLNSQSNLFTFMFASFLTVNIFSGSQQVFLYAAGHYSA